MMFYRLAAMPPTWVEVQHFILEDRLGGLFLFDPAVEHIERLDPTDANMLMQWYELSQVVTWHTLPAIAKMLSSTCPRRIDHIGPATSAIANPAVAVGASFANGLFDPSSQNQSGVSA